MKASATNECMEVDIVVNDVNRVDRPTRLTISLPASREDLRAKLADEVLPWMDGRSSLDELTDALLYSTGRGEGLLEIADVRLVGDLADAFDSLDESLATISDLNALCTVWSSRSEEIKDFVISAVKLGYLDHVDALDLGCLLCGDEMRHAKSGWDLVHEAAENIHANTSYAIYSATDRSLRFYSREEMPEPGDAFDGREATEVYDLSETFDLPPWYEHRAKIALVAAEDPFVAPASMKGWFARFGELVRIDLSNFDTSNVTEMFSMFYDCRSLTTLDVSSFDTTNVTNMDYMFCSCRSLTALDVSNFDTSKVTDMDDMFFLCDSLSTITTNDREIAYEAQKEGIAVKKQAPCSLMDAAEQARTALETEGSIKKEASINRKERDAR